MRLPSKSADYTDIDEAQALEMIHYAIDHGVNYLDTAYGYHGGKSEILVGKALKGGYRQKVKVAKLPVWLVDTVQDMDRYLDEQARKLDTEHIDFYLFHDLNKDRWAKLERLEALNWARKGHSKGKRLVILVFFSRRPETFKKIIDAYPWTFCQDSIQLSRH